MAQLGPGEGNSSQPTRVQHRGDCDTLTKPANSGNCSSAFASNIHYSYALNALNFSKESV